VKILDRYILRELLSPFLFATGAFTMVFLMANVLFQLTEMIAQHKLGLWDAAKLLVLWLPYFMRYTFPMAMLLGTLLSLGRLSGEQEMVAMAAGGVSFTRLMAPLALAGSIVSLVTLAFNEQVCPAATDAAERILAARGMATGYADDIVLRGYEGKRLASILSAARLNVREGTMRDLILVVNSRRGPSMTIWAKRARWQGRTWRFYEGTMVFPLEKLKPTVSFGKEGMDMELRASPLGIARRDRALSEISWRELRALVRRLREVGAQRGHRGTVAAMVVELHNKLSVPFASLVFALLAAPLAVRPQRSSRAWGFGLSLLVIFVYYIIWNYLVVLAGGEVVPPWLAAWLPNVLGLGVAGALIRRQTRH
jgi:lipopolysaccharide export system permease protein